MGKEFWTLDQELSEELRYCKAVSLRGREKGTIPNRDLQETGRRHLYSNPCSASVSPLYKLRE